MVEVEEIIITEDILTWSLDISGITRKWHFEIYVTDGYRCILKDIDGNTLSDIFPLRKLQRIGQYKCMFPVDKESPCAYGDMRPRPDSDTFWKDGVDYRGQGPRVYGAWKHGLLWSNYKLFEGWNKSKRKWNTWWKYISTVTFNIY